MQYNNDVPFNKGSMPPKMDACIGFIKEIQVVTIFTNPENAIVAIQGKSGIKIVP